MLDEYEASTQESSVQQTRLDAMSSLVGMWDAKNTTDSTWSDDELVAFFQDCQFYCFWPMTLSIAEEQISNLSIKCLELAAYAAFQMGYLSLAETFVRRGLLIEQKNSYLLQLGQDFGAWSGFCHQYKLNQLFSHDESNLFLQLLGQHHLDSFMTIYDSETAELCCLPAFVDSWDWHQWLEDQYGTGDQLTFAVMHPDYGMIGSVSLVLHDKTGFFYYWIGQGFRGHSFGPMAVSLLLEMASSTWGIEKCYAKVFQGNEASRRGLQKLGFNELPIRAAEPFENELYYCLGDTSDMDAVTDDMYDFYQKIKCWKPFTRPLMSTQVNFC